ncbi:hypothetical protein DFJ73DRAFT_831714 [Zopfochytrium polystomum]|nr:hypothetical protein DFJ73DRAFT_831714 [Zopfochytrium polystomum]
MNATAAELAAPPLPPLVLATICRAIEGPRDRCRLATLLRLRALQYGALLDQGRKPFDAASAAGDALALAEMLLVHRRRLDSGASAPLPEPNSRARWSFSFPFSVDSVVAASRNGDINVLQWWRDCELGPYMFEDYTRNPPRPMDIASRSGHVAVLQWWLDHSRASLLRFCHPPCAVANAAEAGHVDVLQWWMDHWPETQNDSACFLKKHVLGAIDLDGPSANGHVAVLSWTMEKDCQIKYSEAAVDGASKNGHIEVLDWWKSSGLTFKYTAGAIDFAARAGQVVVLQWWVDSGFELMYDNLLIDCASADGQFGVLEWLNHQNKIKVLHSTRAMDLASRNGHLAVLDWWLRHRGRLQLKYSPDAMDDATKAGRIDVLQWWADSGLKLRFNRFILDDASASGQVEALRWWTQLPARLGAFGTGDRKGRNGRSAPVLPHRLQYSNCAVDIASQRGHISVLDWWMKESGLPMRYSARAFDGARGKPHVLQWWRESGLEIKTTSKDVRTAAIRDVDGEEED